MLFLKRSSSLSFKFLYVTMFFFVRRVSKDFVCLLILYALISLRMPQSAMRQGMIVLKKIQFSTKQIGS